MGAVQRAAAAWSGPKGFASVVYGLLVLDADVARADPVLHLVASVVLAEIRTHSSTDVLIARALARADERASREPGATPATG